MDIPAPKIETLKIGPKTKYGEFFENGHKDFGQFR
jgi:hypothetical protein